MHPIFRFLHQLAEEESGQDLIEYSLVAALIGLGAVASMRTLATHVQSALSTIGSNLTGAI